MEPPTATISETAELEYDEDDGDEESEYGSEIDEADLSDEERKHCLSKRQKRNQNKLFKPQEYRWQKQTPPSVIRKNPAAKRDRSQVAEESPHYDKTKFPDRVMLACDQKPYFDKKKQKNVGIFHFWLFPNMDFTLYHLTTRLFSQPLERRFYAVAEAAENLFHFMDCEMEMRFRDPEIHGDKLEDLVRDAFIVVRSLLEEYHSLNLSLWDQNQIFVFVSMDPRKWSVHIHIAWPDVSTADISIAMHFVHERLWELFRVGMPLVKRLFYWDAEKQKWRSFIDMGVYSEQRNMRLPFNTKHGKDAYLVPMYVEGLTKNSEEYHAYKQLEALIPTKATQVQKQSDANNNNDNTNGKTEIATETADMMKYYISAAMILCKLSRPLWNSSNCFGGEKYMKREKQRAFRTLPSSSQNASHNSWIKNLLRSPPPQTYEALLANFQRLYRLFFQTRDSELLIEDQDSFLSLVLRKSQDNPETFRLLGSRQLYRVFSLWGFLERPGTMITRAFCEMASRWVDLEDPAKIVADFAILMLQARVYSIYHHDMCEEMDQEVSLNECLESCVREILCYNLSADLSDSIDFRDWLALGRRVSMQLEWAYLGYWLQKKQQRDLDTSVTPPTTIAQHSIWSDDQLRSYVLLALKSWRQRAGQSLRLDFESLGLESTAENYLISPYANTANIPM